MVECKEAVDAVLFAIFNAFSYLNFLYVEMSCYTQRKIPFFDIVGDFWISRDIFYCSFIPHQSKQRISLWVEYLYVVNASLYLQINNISLCVLSMIWELERSTPFSP